MYSTIPPVLSLCAGCVEFVCLKMNLTPRIFLFRELLGGLGVFVCVLCSGLWPRDRGVLWGGRQGSGWVGQPAAPRAESQPRLSENSA